MVQVYYPNNVYHLGIVMISIGITIRYLSGEYPNGFGYKSIISQKNSYYWKEGNEYSGRVCIISGILYTICFFIIDIFSINIGNKILISIMTFIVLLFIIVSLTEYHLYKICKNLGWTFKRHFVEIKCLFICLLKKLAFMLWYNFIINCIIDYNKIVSYI